MGGYAYTGDRAYEFIFIFVALFGFLMVLGGSVLTGLGQANRPRMGGRKARRKEDDAEDEDTPGLTTRLKTSVSSLVTRLPSDEDDETDEAEEDETVQATPAPEAGPEDDGTLTATLQCQRCDTIFQASGTPPFDASCPECSNAAQVELPTGRAPALDGSAEPTGSPRSQPAAPEAPSPQAGPGSPPATGPEATGDLSLQLSCEHCQHVFTARGDPPFEVACPDCGHRGRIGRLPG